MKTKLLLSFALLLSSSAFATPNTKSLEELAGLSGYETIFYENIATPLMMERMSLIENMLQDDKLTDEQRKQAIKIYDDYAEGLLSSLDTEATKTALKNAYLSAAKANYTQGEVDAQIAFYGSENGKNALKKQEAVLSTYMQNAGNASKNIITTYENKNLKKMQDDIKKALKK
ncbi:DUF2059 domain-containing protein [Moraxella oblonga]|uniref:DUF2059 domain-containing protein n=1 Tax=Moraxella oblonga TaxID=200413 RepID=UPI000832152C|nr:DUF2059 domain-containing protein [Moraxella oblonga]